MSNSNQQREYIEEQARERGITNLNVITGDVAKVTNKINKQKMAKTKQKNNKLTINWRGGSPISMSSQEMSPR